MNVITIDKPKRRGIPATGLPPFSPFDDSDGENWRPRCYVCGEEDENLGSGIFSFRPPEKKLCHLECYEEHIMSHITTPLQMKVIPWIYGCMMQLIILFYPHKDFATLIFGIGISFILAFQHIIRVFCVTKYYIPPKKLN